MPKKSRKPTKGGKKNSKKDARVKGSQDVGLRNSLNINSTSANVVNYANTQAYLKLDTNLLRSLVKLATDLDKALKTNTFGLNSDMVAAVKKTFIAKCRTKTAKTSFTSPSNCYTKKTLNEFPQKMSATELKVSASPNPKKQAAFCDTLLSVVDKLYSSDDKFFKSRITLALNRLKKIFVGASGSTSVSSNSSSKSVKSSRALVKTTRVLQTKTRGNTPRSVKSSKSSRALALRKTPRSASNSRSWRVRTASNTNGNRSNMNVDLMSASLNATGLRLQNSQSNSSFEVDCTGKLNVDAKSIAKGIKHGLSNCSDGADYTVEELKAEILKNL